METLLSLSAVSGEHDLKALRRLYNEVETNIWSLRALGVEQDTYGAMLTSVLLTKLPHEIRLIITRRLSGEDLNLQTLQTTSEKKLIARERSCEILIKSSHPLQDKTQTPFIATTTCCRIPRAKQKACCCLLLLPIATSSSRQSCCDKPR